jgi:hypothetical protein
VRAAHSEATHLLFTYQVNRADGKVHFSTRRMALVPPRLTMLCPTNVKVLAAAGH